LYCVVLLYMINGGTLSSTLRSVGMWSTGVLAVTAVPPRDSSAYLSACGQWGFSQLMQFHLASRRLAVGMWSTGVLAGFCSSALRLVGMFVGMRPIGVLTECHPAARRRLVGMWSIGVLADSAVPPCDSSARRSACGQRGYSLSSTSRLVGAWVGMWSTGVLISSTSRLVGVSQHVVYGGTRRVPPCDLLWWYSLSSNLRLLAREQRGYLQSSTLRFVGTEINGGPQLSRVCT
jgi:hypothetical protein